jgi:uroporphyrinogen-III synthase
MSVSTAYVLSTRPLAGPLIDEAAANGVTIDVLSFIGTKQVEEKALTSLLQELGQRSLMAVFTSSSAVAAIKDLEQPHWKVFCLGGATQRAAAARFGGSAILQTADSAKELAEMIISREAPGELWFFCGDKRREELPEKLRAASWMVHEVVVYHTVLTPHRIDKTYDAIAFFSPSAVQSFFSVNCIEPQVRLFAIGRTTAASLHEHCPNPVTISERPDEQTLIRQIITNSQT